MPEGVNKLLLCTPGFMCVTVSELCLDMSAASVFAECFHSIPHRFVVAAAAAVVAVVVVAMD